MEQFNLSWRKKIMESTETMESTGTMETTETTVEQRHAPRTDLCWPVSIWLPEANRFFNARSSNISKSGVFLTVPMTMPIRAGHELEINFPRSKALAKEKGGFARIKSGKVVRVERRNTLQDASIGVAVRFE
jgi:hypothetical protein